MLTRLKFCWRILNFAGAVFEAKVELANNLHQQKSAGVRQKIPPLGHFANYQEYVFKEYFVV